MRHSNSIDFFRVIFILILIIHHLDISLVIRHGYLVVEFFGILSGFLLARSANRTDLSAFEYTFNKYKRFAPVYIWALFMQIVAVSVQSIRIGQFDLTNTVFRALPEMFMLSDIGMFTSAINYPMWYLSPLMVGGAILYYLISKHKEVTQNIIIPLVIIITYTCIFGNSEQIEWFATIGGFSLMFWRVVADLCIGILTYKFLLKFSEYSGYLINIFFFISTICSIILFIADKYYDNYALVFFPILIMGCFTNKCIINKWFENERYLTWLSKYSFSIYCNHAVIGGIFHTYITSHVSSVLSVILCQIMYIVVVIVYSIFVYNSVTQIINFLKQFKKTKIRSI